MDFIKDWVKDIFLIIAGLYFIEIVLPSGEIKKYVKFVFSIMILGVVIAPLTEIAQKDVDAFSFGNMPQFAPPEEEWNYDIQSVQDTQVIEIYRQKLKDEILKAIEEDLPDVQVQSVEVHLYEDAKQKDYGKVKMVVINGADSEYQNSIRNLLSEKFGLNKEIRMEGKD